MLVADGLFHLVVLTIKLFVPRLDELLLTCQLIELGLDQLSHSVDFFGAHRSLGEMSTVLNHGMISTSQT